MNIIRLVFVAFLIVTPSLLLSQTYVKTAEFSAHNPTTSEMARFSLTPVNKYIGKANVSIPLYSMDFDGLKIPFNLSYDTGGVKVSQESSWVGLGWNLSGIPTITHIINQFSDVGTGRSEYPDSCKNTGYCFEPTLPNHYSGFDYQELALGPDYSIGATYDTQPDIFIASLYGSTVVFQLTQKAQTNGVIEARIINDSNAIISYNESLRIFVITDENGFKYHFPYTESTSQLTIPNNSLFGSGEPEPENIYFTNANYSSCHDANIPKAWYPDKIISPNNKELKFTYYGEDEGREGYYHLSMPSFVQTKSAFVCGIDYNNGSLDGSNFPDSFGSYSAIISRVESKIPKEMINMSTGERVVFNTSDRLDLVPFQTVLHSPLSLMTDGHYDINDKPLKLSRLDIFSSNGQIIKNIIFDNNTYFNSQHASDEYPQKNLRLKLDGISIDGLNYIFEYDSPNALPKKNSMDVDFWGFYNGAGNLNRFPSLTFNEYFCVLSDPEVITNEESIDGGMLGSKFSSGKIGSLIKVTFPTGGYTKYEYESNTTAVSLDSTSKLYAPFSYSYLMTNNLEPGYPLTSTQDSNLKTFKIGGLRVASVKSFDHNNTLLLEKQYKYESLENSSIPVSTGKLMSKLYYFDIFIESSEGGNVQFTKVESSSVSKNGSLSSAMGSHVGYDLVEEIIKSNNSNYTSGRIVTKYLNEPSSDLVGEFGGFQFETMPYHYENNNGLVKEEIIYYKFNRPLKHIINTYDYYQSFIAKGYKIYYGSITDIFQGQTLSVNPVSEVYSYSTKKYVPLLSGTTVIEYLTNDTISTVTTNQYNSRQRLKASSTNLSENPSAYNKVEFYYPYDTEYGVSSYPFMSTLVNKNRVASAVYFRKYKNNVLIGHEFQPYKNFRGLILPNSVNYQKTDAPLTNIEERVRYIDYDSFGNLTEKLINQGSLTKYIWGYEGSYPIARILNAPENSDLENIVDIEALQNSRMSISTVSSEINSLKNHSNYADSQIQQYTFKPGVGMITNTSPRNYSTNFHYDNLERLIRVSDDDNSIISQHSYNYINENSNCTDCLSIELNANKYLYYKNENVTISYNLPLGIPTITNWRLELGDNKTLEGQGAPPSSFSAQYNFEGMRNIRMYVYFSENNFITGNINVRVISENIPGGDVYFGDVQNGDNSHPTTGVLYGDPNSVVTYTVDTNGSTSELTGKATVDNNVTDTTQPAQPVTKTVTIPASGYVNCSVQTFPGTNTLGSGGTYILILNTTIGQVGSSSSLSHSYSSYN